ncbi:MAG: DNA topoisomerase I [Candidatus Marinimicrobia bacterium]|nr:DNA topoisomerase I [Candidatus Neomarinimicrobiota bacterium]|tara:strand:+ start:234 stop:2678 length:2445 start_codon:yes stop_codon:yes gene_type:complete
MNTSQKRMIIVESPSKIKTINKFLGSEYIVESSVGHIRDLPSKDIGIDIENDFTTTYVDSDRSKDVIKKLKSQLKKCSELYIATDPDREGEAIAWHIVECLKPKVPIKRLVFNEITKKAVLESFNNIRKIDGQLFAAQESRRILDRLFGFLVSKTLWFNVKGGLSAGRVQSPALKILVDREKARTQFIENEYWSLKGDFVSANTTFSANLISIDSNPIAKGTSFNKETGKLLKTNTIVLDQEKAEKLATSIKDNNWLITFLETKPATQNPYPPFITSTLQQEGIRKLNLNATQVMSVAQKLYENGFITYMRTDSISLSSEAINAARQEIKKLYGDNYLPDAPRVYKAKSKNAQEAHEAIRPAGSTFKHPDELQNVVNDLELKLYKLIWKRTMACQMKSAKLENTTMHISDDEHIFEAKGKVIKFDGFLKAYVEDKDYQENEKDDKESVLPNLSQGDSTICKELEPKQHFTKPINRYTEASLVKELEKLGIGRPSTYASIMKKIIDKGYVNREGKSTLIPTFTGYAIVHFLEKYFDDLVNLEYTASMENHLDEIASGSLDKIKYLNEFYFGQNNDGLESQLEQEFDKEFARTILQISENDKNVDVKIGRYGIYAQSGDNRVNIDDALPPSEFDIDIVEKQLADKLKGDKEIAIDPNTKEPIYLKNGKFGPYVNCGKKNKGLLPNMKEEDVTPEIAIQLISLPKKIGVYEDNDITIDNGKFGPYIRCGKLTRSVKTSLFDLQESEAVKLLESDPSIVKKFKDSDIVVKKGRFNRSDYIQQGKVNASIPKGINSEEITLEEAEKLIVQANEKKSKKK